jgi:hypothetical protein
LLYSYPKQYYLRKHCRTIQTVHSPYHNFLDHLFLSIWKHCPFVELVQQNANILDTSLGGDCICLC